MTPKRQNAIDALTTAAAAIEGMQDRLESGQW